MVLDIKISKKKVNRKNKQKAVSPYTQIDWEKASLLFQRATKTQKGNSKYPQVKEILRILAAVGGIGLVFAFPGAAAGISSMILGEASYSSWRTRKIFNQLSGQKYISTKYGEDGQVTVKITQKGMIKALSYQLDTMKVDKPKRWDNRWRVVIFDIPDKYKRVRDIFRARLVQIGLHRLQESVYVSPYNCFQEVEFLRQLYGVAFTVRYLLVEKIEDDKLLKQNFDLS